MDTKQVQERGGARERPAPIRKSACGRGGVHIPGQSGLFIKRFMYLLLSSPWLSWVSAPARGLSLVTAGGGPSLVVEFGFAVQWLLLPWSSGPGAPAHWLWCLGLSAPQHVGASWTMDLTPALASRFLTTQTTREAPSGLLINGGSPGTAFGRKIK